ncbi:MAG TPA: dihydrolipoyl dehydrogenase, partial [bacterium]|nr:dihydrolipoyl dehydrogenase [bacterium]
MAEPFDVIVLGSGPGGYVAAERAAQLGMRTALVEKDELGGVCLNWGCIPTKALLESAHAWGVLQDAGKYGLGCDNPSVDFAAVIARSRSIADRMSKGVGFLMKRRGVTVIKGTGSLKNRSGAPDSIWTVTVDPGNGAAPEDVNGRHVILATGGRPMALPGTPFDGERVLHSTHAMSLTRQPRSIIIIGAGAIGREFASFYRRIGTDVTVIEMMPQVLPNEDAGIVNELNRSLRRQKITVMTDSRVTAVDLSGNDVRVTAATAKGDRTVSAEKLIMAIGVRANSENLGLETAGVTVDRGFVPVDDRGRTSVPGIYAIGDLTGPPLLAHKASAQALVCVDTIAGIDTHPVNFDHIPGCTYCDPQVASVGLTEAAARDRGIDVKTGTFPFRANGRS